MAMINKIQKNPLNEVFQQLIADIRTISQEDGQLAVADIEKDFQNHRIRVGYSVKQLAPANVDREELCNGGLRR